MQTNNKLREALEDIGRIVEQIRLLYSDYPYETHLIARKASAALAAPPRNCDVGAAEEQEERFTKVCKANSKGGVRGLCSETCPFGRDYQSECALAWAQMPYVDKKGGAK